LDNPVIYRTAQTDFMKTIYKSYHAPAWLFVLLREPACSGHVNYGAPTTARDAIPVSQVVTSITQIKKFE